MSRPSKQWGPMSHSRSLAARLAVNPKKREAFNAKRKKHMADAAAMESWARKGFVGG